VLTCGAYSPRDIAEKEVCIFDNMALYFERRVNKKRTHWVGHKVNVTSKRG